jgi:hypothetical protein
MYVADQIMMRGGSSGRLKRTYIQVVIQRSIEDNQTSGLNQNRTKGIFDKSIKNTFQIKKKTSLHRTQTSNLKIKMYFDSLYSFNPVSHQPLDIAVTLLHFTLLHFTIYFDFKNVRKPWSAKS